MIKLKDSINESEEIKEKIIEENIEDKIQAFIEKCQNDF